ncbi:hypothetical protein Pmani_027081 [Petrolisthes manimaculis]|uniref:Large ribosomal subunit protein eL30 n=1 Tax=Petrolisthes manimaculis TaxID=1843537 RepID=A0AAE1P4W5_9EUCA|nr:hypothetical protein Pmani_027081 [Petrolisthes manimaculis]
MKSGKYQLGYKQTLKCLRAGKAKLVIIASNTPSLRKSEIEYYAMLAKTECAPLPSLILVTPILSEQCQLNNWKLNLT